MADKSLRFGLFADDEASAKLDRMGAAAEGAGGKLRDAGDSGREYGKGLDKAIEASDNVDTRAMGFRDTMTGVQDSMKGASLIAKGDLFNGFLTLGMGVGDLASGMVNFLLPSLGKWIAGSKVAALGTRVWSATTYGLGVAMRFAMGPIGLAIAAAAVLAAGIIYVYRHSETFRRVVTSALGAVKAAAVGVWNWVKSNWPYLLGALAGPFGLAAVWITKHWDQVVGFFAGIPGRLRRAGTGMWNWIAESFRAALNAIIGWWDNLNFKAPTVHIPGTNVNVGGFTIPLPYIHPLAKGGITTGPTLAMLGDNPSGREAVIPLDGDMPLGVVQLVLDGRVIHQALLQVKRGQGGAALGLA